MTQTATTLVVDVVGVTVGDVVGVGDTDGDNVGADVVKQ